MRKKLFSVGIKDCRVDTFTVGGNGGGGKDTSNSGVRIFHPPSGATGIARDHRSQFKNKQLAFKRMADSSEFRAWIRLVVSRLASGKSIDQLVEESMVPENLKIEVRKDGVWTVVT